MDLDFLIWIIKTKKDKYYKNTLKIYKISIEEGKRK
jgi:hypothetical protein